MSPNPFGFRGGSSAGCGGGSSLGIVPPGGSQLRIHLRIWVEPRAVPPADLPRVFDRPPDYEASEPVPWTVMP